MMGFKGTLKVDEARGVVHFLDQDGTCVLRVEGLSELKKLMDEGKQIDVRIMASLPRTDEYRDWADKEEAVIRAYRVKPLDQVRRDLRLYHHRSDGTREIRKGDLMTFFLVLMGISVASGVLVEGLFQLIDMIRYVRLLK